MGNYHARFYEGLGRGDTPCLLSTGNNSQFTYDGIDHCVKIVETVGDIITSTKQLIWCHNRMCEARDAAGAITAQYFTRGQTISGNTYHYSTDQIDSIRALTDSTGATRALYQYDPYGRVTKLQGDLDSDFQYAGYYVHSRSGLNLTRNRAYSPNLGRWLNRDPIQEDSGVNLYGYVNNSPVKYIDASGLIQSDPGAGFAIPGGPGVTKFYWPPFDPMDPLPPPIHGPLPPPEPVPPIPPQPQPPPPKKKCPTAADSTDKQSPYAPWKRNYKPDWGPAGGTPEDKFQPEQPKGPPIPHTRNPFLEFLRLFSGGTPAY